MVAWLALLLSRHSVESAQLCACSKAGVLDAWRRLAPPSADCSADPVRPAHVIATLRNRKIAQGYPCPRSAIAAHRALAEAQWWAFRLFHAFERSTAAAVCAVRACDAAALCSHECTASLSCVSASQRRCNARANRHTRCAAAVAAHERCCQQQCRCTCAADCTCAVSRICGCSAALAQLRRPHSTAACTAWPASRRRRSASAAGERRKR